MKLVLNTISKPITGPLARRVARAVDRGGSVVNAQGKAFIASLLEEMHQFPAFRPQPAPAEGLFHLSRPRGTSLFPPSTAFQPPSQKQIPGRRPS